MGDVVTIDGLEHRYGATHALRGVDLTVARGECVALLGPNGAGKTTLVNALIGLLKPSAGHVQIDGGDPRLAQTRRRLGVVHQQAGFPRTLTVRELVSGWAIRAGRPGGSATAVLGEVGLDDLAARRVDKLSGGQQQRLQLAMALVVDPTLLVLDEPTVGLDIEARRTFWSLLATRRDAGVAILLTTHNIEEAAAFADRVVVLHEGSVVASDRPGALTSRLPDRSVSARTALSDDELNTLPDVVGLVREPASAGADSAPDQIRFATSRPEDAVRALLHADPTLSDLRVEGASLEQAVLSLTTSPVEVLR